MTRQEILALLKELVGAYPQVTIKDPDAMVRVWEMNFGEYDASVIYKAARYHMRKSRFFPTPHDIYEAIPKGELLYDVQESTPKIASSDTAIVAPVAPRRNIKVFCKAAEEVLPDGTAVCPFFNGGMCDGTEAEFDICEL